MFEAAELGHRTTSQTYDAELPKLRSGLLNAHLELRTRKFPVIVIVSGADGAGKGELVHRLNEWLDPRGVATHAFWKASDEELERPAYARFWRAMPGRGRVGIFFGSWYSEPIIRRVYRKTKTSELDAALDRVVAFEKMLTDDGAIIVKVWLHLPKKEQKKRLRKLEQDGRLAPTDWKHYKLFDKFLEVSERSLRHTDSPAAPWHVVEATDRRYRELTVGRILLDALQAGLERPVKPPAAATPPAPANRKRSEGSILDHVDLSQRLSEKEYTKQLETYQRRLSQLAWKMNAKERSAVLVFEGWDAAGKGSAIRRVTQALDPRLYRVVGIAAPNEEERAQHYLWRFWRQLPRAGFTTIFDRSWYGRVLVERVEGFASPSDWMRAYGEINEFEDQMAAHGITICKFWLHISRDEQLRRFKERQTVAYKRYKITEEDWRNREKWAAYQAAVDDMVARCSTGTSPWTLVAGNDKKFARIQILRTIVKEFESVV